MGANDHGRPKFMNRQARLDRDRHLWLLRLEGRTLKQTGAAFKLSPERTRQLILGVDRRLLELVGALPKSRESLDGFRRPGATH